MNHEGEAQLDPELFAIVDEGSTSELCIIIGDDAIGHSKASHNSSYEVECCVCCDLGDGLGLHPLSELVDGNVKVLVASDSSRETSQNIHPLGRERP